jgi:uncharacterized repeat protein (TIGR02543 family)
MKTKRPLPKRFSGTIRVSGILLGLVAVLLGAASIAMAAPVAYVSKFSSAGTVSVITTTGCPPGRAACVVGNPVAVGPLPLGVAVNPTRSRAYVVSSNFFDETEASVWVIDTATGNRLATVGNVGNEPSGVAVSADGNSVYVVNRNGTVVVIDANTNTARSTPLYAGSPLLSSMLAADITVKGSLVLVTDPINGRVVAIDANTGGFREISVGPYVMGIAASPTDARVYVASSQDAQPAVWVIDTSLIFTAANPVIAKVFVGTANNFSESSPAGIAVSPSGRLVFVAISNENTIEVIDTMSAPFPYQILKTVDVGAMPFGVATDPDPAGNLVFVGNSNSGSVSVVTTDSSRCVGGEAACVIATVPVGGSPQVFGSFVGLTQTFHTLTTSTTGNGTIDPAGGSFAQSSPVTLTARPNTGSQFSSWGGDCQGVTSATCNLTMNGPKNVTATFTLLNYSLTTSMTGNGTIDPAAGSFPYGSPVTLTARPNTGSQFSSWGGDCLGVTGATCSLTMNGPKNVTATFAVVQYTLTPVVSPSGAGTTIPTAPTKYNDNAQVTVTAQAKPGYQFTGWTVIGGACPGTGACTVTMTGDRTVTANFVPVAVQQFTLTLSQDGTGTGTVGALPTSSTGRYDPGTDVAVTATPKAGCKFVRWSGACSGNSSCKVTMNASKSVVATFELTVSPCDDRIADLQKKVAADKRHVKYGLDVQEAFRLYAAAQSELARAAKKVGESDKRYQKALKELNNGKAALCDGRYWRAAHEFWEAYLIAYHIVHHHHRR